MYLVIFVWSKSKERISSDADRAPVHGMQEIPTFFWAWNNSLTTKLCVFTANNPLLFLDKKNNNTCLQENIISIVSKQHRMFIRI